MFRSRRRDVVVPQSEHARLSAGLATAWSPPPPVPHEAFVRAVAEHDRGYGALDADGIGEVPHERWLAIQRASRLPRGDDPLVDLLVALHVRRLLGFHDSPGARAETAELDASLPGLYELAAVSPEAAAAANDVTGLCDAVAFAFAFEEPVERTWGGRRWWVDGERIGFEPWPFAPDRLAGELTGYRADGYPGRLEPVSLPWRAERGASP